MTKTHIGFYGSLSAAHSNFTCHTIWGLDLVEEERGLRLWLEVEGQKVKAEGERGRLWVQAEGERVRWVR